jgi:hypothetical protein
MSVLPALRGLLPAETLGDILRLAEMLARSSMVPESYRGQPQDVAVAVLWGAEVGLGPLQSLQSISVINGRPAIWGDGALALVRAHPACERVSEGVEGEGDVRHGWCEVARRGHPPERRTFSVADAKRVKLWGKTGRNGAPTPWVTYPDRMLQTRARGFALRDVFPDALRGVITAEEAADIPAEPRFVPATEPPPSPPPCDAVGPGGMIGLGEFKLPALQDALDGCADADALRAYLESCETWLDRLRRNQPDRAREADAMVSAAWDRVRQSEATPAWRIVGSNGEATQCPRRAEWLAAWKAKVAAIEAAPRSPAGRRSALGAMLRANHHALRAVERVNADAALEATKASADADSRLAALEAPPEAMAAE